jgi:hypothetical protein
MKLGLEHRLTILRKFQFKRKKRTVCAFVGLAGYYDNIELFN